MSSNHYLHSLKDFLQSTSFENLISTLLLKFVYLACFFVFCFRKFVFYYYQLKDVIRSTSIENLISGLILIFVFLYIFSSFYSHNTPQIKATVSQIIANLMMVLLLVLFIYNTKQLIINFNRNETIRWIAFQFVVIPTSIFISRYLISTAIGLPPQDYNLTALAITPFIYVYVVCFIIALIPLTIIALHLCLLLLRSFFSTWTSIFVTLTGIISFSAYTIEPKLFTYLQTPQPTAIYFILYGLLLVPLYLDAYHPLNLNKPNTWSSYKYHLKNLSILVACILILDTFEKNLFKHGSIKLIAYYVDYFELPHYPNLKLNQKVHIHANGVISYAIKNGWDVQIRVDKYD